MHFLSPEQTFASSVKIDAGSLPAVPLAALPRITLYSVASAKIKYVIFDEEVVAPTIL